MIAGNNLRQILALHRPEDRALWGRWVLANTVGEVIGIGLAAGVGVTLVWALEPMVGTPGVLAGAGVMVVAGTLEGLAVGLAQGTVLRGQIKVMRLRAWVLATALGAFIAWILGMLPSTLMNFEQATNADPVEINNLVMYTMAAGMGFVLGPILGLPQWIVLRRYVRKAGWWILANALAWAVGMVLIFMGVDVAVALEAGAGGIALIGAVTGGLSGAAVGAIHGLFLVWLLRTTVQPAVSF